MKRLYDWEFFKKIIILAVTAAMIIIAVIAITRNFHTEACTVWDCEETLVGDYEVTVLTETGSLYAYIDTDYQERYDSLSVLFYRERIVNVSKGEN